jgi:hypothetical protein
MGGRAVALLVPRPKRRASHRLLRLVGDGRWKMNLSVPLVLEYEQTLKRVCAGATLTSSDIGDILDSVAAPGSFPAMMGEKP